MEESIPTPELSDREKLEKLISSMDDLLANGRASVARYEAFALEHGIEAGCGEKTLLGPRVPPREREVFRRLLAEYAFIEERIKQFEELAKKPAPRPVGNRAIGNRYRI